MPLHGTAKAIADKLIELGFTQYEAKVYIVLATGGTLNPTEIADRSGVPRPNVYRVLEKLEAEGFARKEAVQRGARYLAVPIEEVLSKLEEKLKTKQEAVSKLKALIKDLTTAEIVSASETMWLISGEKEIKKLINKLIEKAKEELIILTPPRFGQEETKDKEAILNQLIKKTAKGLDLIIGWPISKSDVKFVEKLSDKSTIYHWDLGEVPMGIYCSDGRECLITFIGKWAPILSYDLGLWIRNPIYVKPIQYLASKLLTINRSSEERLKELIEED
ncbi:MAG: TrmB family transcriptional regulator [Candidatus Odinarchaeia archaeon]